MSLFLSLQQDSYLCCSQPESCNSRRVDSDIYSLRGRNTLVMNFIHQSSRFDFYDFLEDGMSEPIHIQKSLFKFKI
jgi:hypothetical protein